MNSSDRQKGISLLEVVIVFAITAVLVAVSMPNFHDYSARARVVDALEQASPAQAALVRTCTQDNHAVVKSNAHGHGVREILPRIPSADWLAVNSLDEGLEIRALGETRPVLLMGHVPLDRLKEARDADLRFILCNQYS